MGVSLPPQALPESFREVIVLRVLEGLSVSETAAIMQRSPGAISVLLTNTIKRLGRLIAAPPAAAPQDVRTARERRDVQ